MTKEVALEAFDVFYGFKSLLFSRAYGLAYGSRIWSGAYS